MLTEDNYSAIGTYWEKSNLNEIDIVAVNDYEKRLIIAEVKRQVSSTSLVCKLKDYHVEYRGLSMLDM